MRFTCSRYGFRLVVGRRGIQWPLLTIAGGRGVPPPPPHPYSCLPPYCFSLIVATPTYWRRWVWQ